MYPGYHQLLTNIIGNNVDAFFFSGPLQGSHPNLKTLSVEICQILVLLKKSCNCYLWTEYRISDEGGNEVRICFLLSTVQRKHITFLEPFFLPITFLEKCVNLNCDHSRQKGGNLKKII